MIRPVSVFRRLRRKLRFTILSMIVVWLSALLPGCSTRPPALPPVTPDQLPSVWLDSLSARACPDPLRARLVLRVEPRDGSAVTLDGTLNAAPPDTMQVGVRLGAFRPLFALRADADSCQILVHGESAYWTTPRGSPDWGVMNPSAWVTALGWALCPRDLYTSLEPEGPGRIEKGRWHLRGRLAGTPFTASLEVDVSNGSLVSLQVFDKDRTLLDAGIARFLTSASGWVPTRIDLDAPVEGIRIRIYVENLAQWDAGSPEQGVILRPPGWRRVRDRLPLPTPDAGSR